jgi:hypothetical protein
MVGDLRAASQDRRSGRGPQAARGALAPVALRPNSGQVGEFEPDRLVAGSSSAKGPRVCRLYATRRSRAEQQDGVSALGDVVRDFLESALHRLGEGHREPAPTPRAGQTAPNREALS